MLRWENLYSLRASTYILGQKTTHNFIFIPWSPVFATAPEQKKTNYPSVREKWKWSKHTWEVDRTKYDWLKDNWVGSITGVRAQSPLSQLHDIQALGDVMLDETHDQLESIDLIEVGPTSVSSTDSNWGWANLNEVDWFKFIIGFTVYKLTERLSQPHRINPTCRWLSHLNRHWVNHTRLAERLMDVCYILDFPLSVEYHGGGPPGNVTITLSRPFDSFGFIDPIDICGIVSRPLSGLRIFDMFLVSYNGVSVDASMPSNRYLLRLWVRYGPVFRWICWDTGNYLWICLVNRYLKGCSRVYDPLSSLWALSSPSVLFTG